MPSNPLMQCPPVAPGAGTPQWQLALVGRFESVGRTSCGYSRSSFRSRTDRGSCRASLLRLAEREPKAAEQRPGFLQVVGVLGSEEAHHQRREPEEEAHVASGVFADGTGGDSDCHGVPYGDAMM